MYYYTNNDILATGIKRHRAKDLVKGYDDFYKQLLLSEIIPMLQQMDNETSKDLISSINDKKITYQITSVGDY